MAGNAAAVQVRIASADVGNVGGQRAHELRIGPQPSYVVAERKALNRTLAKPLRGVELRAICLERRTLRETKRAMRGNAAVAVTGIITFGHQAQALFEALDADAQDAAYREVAEAVAKRLDTSVSGLVVHRDESAPHAHFQLPGVTHQGHPVSRVAKIGALRNLQTIAAEVMARHCPGIERGTSKAVRLAEGEDYADVVHRSVKELHADLPAEIAALETKAEAARVKAEKNERLAETSRIKATQDGEKAEKAAERAEAYEQRASGARAELERLSAEVERLRGLVEAAEARRADGQRALDRVSGTLATARRDLADVEGALAQKKTRIAGWEAKKAALQARWQSLQPA
jgi:hypothetical protein